MWVFPWKRKNKTKQKFKVSFFAFNALFKSARRLWFGGSRYSSTWRVGAGRDDFSTSETSSISLLSSILFCPVDYSENEVAPGHRCSGSSTAPVGKSPVNVIQ